MRLWVRSEDTNKSVFRLFTGSWKRIGHLEPQDRFSNRLLPTPSNLISGKKVVFADFMWSRTFHAPILSFAKTREHVSRRSPLSTSEVRRGDLR